MTDPTFRRIVGFHAEDDGVTAAVWLALDQVSQVVHMYDVARFNTEPMAMIASGIGSRGRNIPLAWRKKDEPFATALLEAGIDVLPEPCSDTDAMAEVLSRQMTEWFRTSRLIMDHPFPEMRTEYEGFNRTDGKVPTQGYPLMAACRHAMEKLDWAKAETFGSRKPCAPDLRPV